LPNWKSIHLHLHTRLAQSIRESEIQLVLDHIASYLAPAHNPKILEFGAGHCYQAKALSRLGSVTATEPIPVQSLEREDHKVNLVVSRLEHAPFKSQSFDLVFSNHVLEHLSDLTGSLAEVHRVGKKDGLFAFTVPTRFWLLVAQPATIGWRIAGLRRSLRQEGLTAVAKLFKPEGHGEYERFGEAFRAFGIFRWAQLLQDHGFLILARIPLLAYAPAELLLPPSRTLARLGFYSSILFILKSAR
jgi:SAM-dependent methyltransferase